MNLDKKIYSFLFLIPDPNEVVSGGNIYNKLLIEALQKSGVNTSQTNIFPKKVESKKEYIIVDTLFLNQAIHHLDKYKKKGHKNSILLVHHLESLYPPSDFSQEQYFEKFERRKLNKFDVFWVTSFFTKKYLRQKKMRQPIVVVPPALSFQATASVPTFDRTHALIVANLVERKGILPFFKALNKMDLEHIVGRLQIDIIGTDQIEPAYALQCLQYLQSHSLLQKVVQFKGPQSQQLLWNSYQEANLFISTSFMETFGMAIQEAVAFKLPILGLDRGNLPFHVSNNKNGHLFEQMESLVKYLNHLVMNKDDFQKLSEKAAAYQPYDQYNWETAALSLTNQIQTIINTRVEKEIQS